jgi:peptide/nickel transport system ATP-binding protein
MNALVALDHVGMQFRVPGQGFLAATRTLDALGDIVLSVPEGRSVGLVGESGCGKSTLARIAAGFLTPTKGSVTRTSAGQAIQMVFQDPLSALDPRMRIGKQIDEAIVLAAPRDREAVARRRVELLEQVGLNAALASRFPHELSGGQRQRVVIARALAADPKLLICDEPLAALDVSVQAQILNLLDTLKQQIGLSLLFISHQLSTVRHLCDEVAVMYAGQIVEQGPTEAVFARPSHPYTRMLLSTVLDPFSTGGQSTYVVGEPPNPMELPTGCAFHPGCDRAELGRCDATRPELSSAGTVRRACHFPLV